MSKLLTFLLCTMPLLAQAQVYKWVDAKGVAHYTDNKFEAGDAPVKEIKPNGPPSTALPDGVTWQERDAEFRRKQQYKLLNPNYRPRQLQASPSPAQRDHRLPVEWPAQGGALENHRTDRRHELGIDGALLPSN